MVLVEVVVEDELEEVEKGVVARLLRVDTCHWRESPGVSNQTQTRLHERTTFFHFEGNFFDKTRTLYRCHEIIGISSSSHVLNDS